MTSVLNVKIRYKVESVLATKSENSLVLHCTNTFISSWFVQMPDNFFCFLHVSSFNDLYGCLMHMTHTGHPKFATPVVCSVDSF